MNEKLRRQKLPQRPRPRNPAADFAHLNEMITDEEYEACQCGDMSIKGNVLMNLNMDHPSIPTGTGLTIYPGRKVRILGNRLLGLKDTD